MALTYKDMDVLVKPAAERAIREIIRVNASMAVNSDVEEDANPRRFTVEFLERCKNQINHDLDERIEKLKREYKWR